MEYAETKVFPFLIFSFSHKQNDEITDIRENARRNCILMTFWISLQFYFVLVFLIWTTFFILSHLETLTFPPTILIPRLFSASLYTLTTWVEPQWLWSASVWPSLIMPWSGLTCRTTVISLKQNSQLYQSRIIQHFGEEKSQKPN